MRPVHITPLLVATALLQAAAFSHRTTIYVDQGATSAIPDGNSWGSAYRFLREALFVAEAGDEIWVARGVYYPDDEDSWETFRIPSGVKLYGGFNATESTSAERDFSGPPSILSGDVAQDDINSDGNFIAEHGDFIRGSNSQYVVTIQNATTCLLDHFAITAASVSALRCENAAPIITHCVFSGNLSNDGTGGAGAAINLNNAPAKIINYLLIGNVTLRLGGAIYGRDSSFELVQCTLTGNRALVDGGALYVVRTAAAAMPRVSNCLILNNAAGGGTRNESASFWSHVSGPGRPNAVQCSSSIVANEFTAGGEDRGGTRSVDPLFAEPAISDCCRAQRPSMPETTRPPTKPWISTAIRAWIKSSTLVPMS